MEQQNLLENGLTSEQCEQVAKALMGEAKVSEGVAGTEWVMFFGTTNAIFVAWMFGVYPEYIWLVFCVEGILLFLLRIRNVMEPKEMAIPGKGNPPQKMIRVLYMLEFCYYCNYIGLIFAVVDACDPPWLTNGIVRWLFAAGFGVSGSLLGATVAFRNQLLFHDVDNTVSVFIHFFPALVFYTIRWHYDRLNAAWPTLFHRGPFDDLGLWEIFVASAAFYLTWFVPYLTWLLTGGRLLPRNKDYDTCFRLNHRSDKIPHDTIFHFNMRETTFGVCVRKIRGYTLAEWEAKCKEHTFGVADVFTYMFVHACCNIVGPSFGLLLYASPYVGGCAIAVTLTLALQAGSGRYSKMIHLSGQVLKLKSKSRQSS